MKNLEVKKWYLLTELYLFIIYLHRRSFKDTSLSSLKEGLNSILKELLRTDETIGRVTGRDEGEFCLIFSQ